jgi:octaprenyl-diphosphate synthase
MCYQFNRQIEKIEAVINAILPKIGDRVGQNRLFPGAEASAYAYPINALVAPGRDLLGRGGKRWRPLLMMLVCKSLGGKEDAALPLAPLVELPHNASLIHDDIEDGSDERRGQPAIHIRYGLDQALNSGSFLYFLSLACVRSWDASPEQKVQVIDLWVNALRDLHLGQAWDICWHRDVSALPGIEDYMNMCRLKTGALARLAVSVGGIAAGNVSETVLKSWEGASENVGVGFQILDDVKNLTTGNPGKKRGDDIVEGKKSLPVLLYLQKRPEDALFIAGCFSAARKGGLEAPEVTNLIQALDDAGVIEEARYKGLTLIQKSRNAFLTGASQAAHGILDLIEWIGK